VKVVFKPTDGAPLPFFTPVYHEMRTKHAEQEVVFPAKAGIQ
jgi:hypothetical protein